MSYYKILTTDYDDYDGFQDVRFTSKESAVEGLERYNNSHDDVKAFEVIRFGVGVVESVYKLDLQTNVAGSLVMSSLYITESMAQIGCGQSDTKEIASICDQLSHDQWNTLDAMNSFGVEVKLTKIGDNVRQALKEHFDEDRIVCLMTYVGAYRSVIGMYPN